MDSLSQHIIEDAYRSFNNRDIEAVLSLMHPEVNWPNGWEGGYLKGHKEVSDYWTKQWQELDPIVTPLAIFDDGGVTVVEVLQTVKDREGKTLFAGTLKHLYHFEHGLIRSMEIRKIEESSGD